MFVWLLLIIAQQRKYFQWIIMLLSIPQQRLIKSRAAPKEN